MHAVAPHATSSQNNVITQANVPKVLSFITYPAIHTDRMLYHCTTLQYNHNIPHYSYTEATF